MDRRNGFGFFRVLLLTASLSSLQRTLESNSDLYCFLTAFRRLQQHEQDIQHTVSDIIEKIIPDIYRNQIKEKNRWAALFKWPQRHVLYRRVAGSVAEGSSLARMFVERNTELSFEFDIEQILFDLPTKLKHVVEDNQMKAGFVKVQTVDWKNCFQCVISFYKDRLHKFIDRRKAHDLHIPTYSIKKLHNEKKQYLHFKVQVVLSFLLKIPIDDIKIETNSTITKASTKDAFWINIKDRQTMKIEYERAYTIKLKWQSAFTRAWIQRKRNWPNLSDLQYDVNESYVIAKSSRHEKNKQNTKEMRYSFGHLERKLTNLRAGHQNLVFFIFKAMFYRYLHTINQDHITSYIAKTIMLWVCESYPPEHSIWRNDKTSTVNVLNHLFQKLLFSLEKHNLPNYFIPEINILKDIPQNIINAAIEATTRIVKNTETFIPTNAEEVLSKTRFFYETLSSVHKLGETFLHKNFQYFDILAMLKIFKDINMNETSSMMKIIRNCFLRERSKEFWNSILNFI